MKQATLGAFLLALLVGCSVTKDNVDPADAMTLQSLEEEEGAANVAFAKAQASGDAVALAAAQERVDAAYASLRQFETAMLRKRFGPVIGGVAQFLGPVGVGLSPLLMGLVPLLGKRGRRHGLRAVQQLNPWKGDPPDGIAPGVAPVAALKDLGRMIGLFHSTKNSELSAATADPIS